MPSLPLGAVEGLEPPNTFGVFTGFTGQGVYPFRYTAEYFGADWRIFAGTFIFCLRICSRDLTELFSTIRRPGKPFVGVHLLSATITALTS